MNERRSRQFSLRELMALTLAASLLLGVCKYFGVGSSLWFGQVAGLAVMAMGLYRRDSQWTARGFGLFAVFLGLALSSLAYLPVRGNAPWSFSRIFFHGILPGLPLVLLGLAALVRGSRVWGGRLFGAFVGALAAVAIPYGMLWHASKNYSGGGANIGLIWLLFALPLYLPLTMAAGAVVGGAIEGAIGNLRSAQERLAGKE